MNVLRRGGAVLLLVGSVLGVALCLGGLIGLWGVRQPTKELVGDVLDTVDSYLTLANQTVQQVGDRTTRLRTTLDNARQELAVAGDTGRGTITDRLAAALQEASGTLASLRNAVQALRKSVATANRMLGDLARLPGIIPPTLPDDLQALEGSLGTIADRLDTLVAAVSDVSVGLTNLTDRLGPLSGELQDLNDRLDQAAARLATAQTAVASAKATTSTAIDLASIGLSLLLVLFAVGQVSLGIQAWGWLQTPSAQASLAAAR